MKFIILLVSLLFLTTSCFNSVPSLEFKEYKPAGEKLDLKVAVILGKRLKELYHTTIVTARCEVYDYNIRGNYKYSLERNGTISATNQVGESVKKTFTKGLPYIFEEIDFYENISEIKNKTYYDYILIANFKVGTSYDEQKALNRPTSRDQYKYPLLSDKRNELFKESQFLLSATTDFQIEVLDSKSEENLNSFSYVYKDYKYTFADHCGNNGLLMDHYSQVIGQSMSYGFKNFLTEVENGMRPLVLAKTQEKALPSDLIISASFSDADGFSPNSMIDAGEESAIIVTVKNNGKGTGYSATLETNSDNSKINFKKSLEIGNIPPQETREIKIPLKSEVDISGGKTTFTFNLKERRGYDAKKVMMHVSTAKLQKPELKIVNVEVNDASTGLANGNGNGIPESGESVELTVYVRNQGEGTAYRVELTAASEAPGIEWSKSSSLIGNISPNETSRSTIVFNIPRDFDGKDIKTLLAAEEARKIGAAARNLSLAFSKQTPVLNHSYRIVLNGKEIKSLVNGEEYNVELTIKNDGKIPANDVTASLDPEEGLMLSSRRLHMGKLAAGESKTAKFNISVPRVHARKNAELGLAISQSDFSAVARSISLPIDVKKPELKYLATLKSRSGGNTLMQGERATLELIVINDGNLPAEGVSLKIGSNSEKLKIEGRIEATIGKIPAGSRSSVERFQVFAFRGLHIGEHLLTVDLNQADFETPGQHYAMNIKEEGMDVIEIADNSMRHQRPSGTNSNLPVINIFNLKDVSETSDGSVQLKFEAADKQGLDLVRVAVNGQIVLTERPRSKSKELTVDVPLAIGSNSLSVTVYNRANEFTQKELIITRAAEENVDQPRMTGLKNPDAVAVVIGISKYDDNRIPGVAYARRDAEVVKKYLIETLGFKEENIQELYDEKATATRIKSFVKSQLRNRIKQGSSDVFIFYSGHGMPEDKEAYIAPYDLIPEDIRNSGYAVNELYKELADLKAKSVTVVMDACFSGFSGGEKSLPLIQNASPVFLEVSSPMLKINNGVVFSSSSGKQLSSWYPKKQHGIFTYYFLLGLKGKADYNNDGRITVQEIDDFLGKNVPEKALNLYNREQTPEVRGQKDKVIVSY